MPVRHTMHSLRTKGQTATEYLLILSVVLIIALVAVGVLQIFPAVHKESSQRSSALELSSLPVGVVGYAVTKQGTTVILKNNNPWPVAILAITSITQEDEISWESGLFPAVLSAGEQVVLTSELVAAGTGSRFIHTLTLMYRDESTLAVRSQQGMVVAGVSGDTD